MNIKSFYRFLTGYDLPIHIDVKLFFSNVFGTLGKKISLQRQRDYLAPWKWVRVFLFISSLSFIFYLNTEFVGVYSFPWLTMFTSSVVPLSIAVLLYELMREKDVSISQLIVIFFVGTAISFFAVGQLWVYSENEFVATVVVAPIVEEIAKALTIFVAINLVKTKNVMTAITIGWVIGAGFQIAETMGYSVYYGLESMFNYGFIDYSVMFLRLKSSLMSHALYGAMEGAALILASDRKTHFNMKRYAAWVVGAWLLHSTWNFILSLEIIPFITYFLMTILQFLAIPILIVFIDIGMKSQDKEELIEHHEQAF